MTMINDDLFGELEYKNNFWRGKTTLRMFDLEKEIILSIERSIYKFYSRYEKYNE